MEFKPTKYTARRLNRLREFLLNTNEEVPLTSLVEYFRCHSDYIDLPDDIHIHSQHRQYIVQVTTLIAHYSKLIPEELWPEHLGENKTWGDSFLAFLQNISTDKATDEKAPLGQPPAQKRKPGGTGQTQRKRAKRNQPARTCNIVHECYIDIVTCGAPPRG